MGISSTQSIDHRAGAWYLCLAMLFAASIDVIAKLLTEDFSTAQIVFLRSLFAIPFAYAICFQQKTTNQLARPLWGWQLYRGLLTVGAQFGFFFGLAYLDLVTALMLAYISPVLIVLAANVILKERIAIKRWIGVSIAFSGVLIMLNPSEFESTTRNDRDSLFDGLLGAFEYFQSTIERQNRPIGSRFLHHSHQYFGRGHAGIW